MFPYYLILDDFVFFDDFYSKNRQIIIKQIRKTSYQLQKKGLFVNERDRERNTVCVCYKERVRNEADETKFLQSVCESVVGSVKEKP